MKPNWVLTREAIEGRGGMRRGGKQTGYEKLQDAGAGLITHVLIGWRDESDGIGRTFLQNYRS